MVYNHKPSMYFHPYAIGESTPLFPFGYGLSYTRYAHSNLRLSQDRIPGDGKVTVSVDVKNCGDRDGEEIVQLYIRDLYSSVTAGHGAEGFPPGQTGQGRDENGRFYITGLETGLL